MADKDFYSTLGVSRGASDAEIKKAYRNLAKKYHPDVNKGDKKSEERFKDISEAYETLSNKKKRQEYDMYGAGGMGGMGGGPHGPGAGGYQGFRSGPFGGFEYSTYSNGSGGQVNYEDLNDIFGDIFGAGVGGAKTRGRQRSAPPMRGADRTYSMEIDFLDAARGLTTKIALPTEEGKTGKINVKIPPGVNSGSKIRLAGKGEPSMTKGPHGDLYIEVKVRPHPYFTREGDDIYLQVPITIGEAVHGAQIEVPTIDGTLKMKIPPGTQGGQKFRLKGKGVPSRKGEVHGDQYVVVNLQLPKHMDAESKAQIEEFSKRNPYHPREGLF